MTFKKLLMGLVAAVCVQCLVLPGSGQQTLGQLSVMNEMVYLGTMEAKSFFVYDGPSRNWTEAKALCNRSNMHLASIANPSEAALLYSKRDTLSSKYTWYHTSARDSHTITQFAFDQDNITALNPGLRFTIQGIKTYQTCVLHSPQDEKGWLDLNLCTTYAGVLCKIHHSN